MSTKTLSRLAILSLVATVSRLEHLAAIPLRLWMRDRISHPRMRAALDLLEPRLESARAELADVIDSAAWGSHDSGRVFVTRRSGWPQDDSGVVRVYVDRIEVCSLEQRNRDYWVPVIADPAAAKEIRARERAQNQAYERWYSAALAEAADLLRHNDPAILAWETDEGQRGGRVHVGAGWISLPGVMRAAGCVASGSWTHIEDFVAIQEAIRESLVVESDERPRLATRDRSMPARDRRRALAAEVAL